MFAWFSFQVHFVMDRRAYRLEYTHIHVLINTRKRETSLSIHFQHWHTEQRHMHVV